MSDVLSFEASSGGTYGDLLSEAGLAARTAPLKVGLLGCGYFEYWRMFSPQFKQRVLDDLERIAGRLRRDFKVVYPGCVDTLDAADAAGRAFAEERIDLLVVAEGTYLPDFISLHAIDRAGDVPLVLFSSQTGDDVGPDDDYEQVMRNSALIGVTQLAGSFVKMGRPFEVVVGQIDDDKPYRRIGSIARARTAARRLGELNIGMIGHVFRGMYDLENDKTKLKGSLGPSVIYVDVAHLKQRWERVADADAAAAAERFAGRFRTRGISGDDLLASCRLGVAMDLLAEELRLDALCFLGQHLIEAQFGAPARIGASMMLQKGQRLVACEGDLAGLSMMHAMHGLSGNPPLQAEWGQFDLSRNALLMIGHGLASPALAASPDAITLTPAPEEWGFQGRGVNMEFILSPGPVTMGHLLDAREGWQMMICGGESLEAPTLPCQEIHALVRVEPPVRRLIEDLARWGVAHHAIIVHGDIRPDLVDLAKALGIRWRVF